MAIVEEVKGWSRGRWIHLEGLMSRNPRREGKLWWGWGLEALIVGGEMGLVG